MVSEIVSPPSDSICINGIVPLTSIYGDSEAIKSKSPEPNIFKY